MAKNGKTDKAQRFEKSSDFSHEERYVASMVLSGVGDALGYHGGRWEFNYNGHEIHKELNNMGGLRSLELQGRNWIVSDDTVMHLATARALAKHYETNDQLYETISHEYIDCMNDMDGRAPGPTSIAGTRKMELEKTYKIPFDSRGGGCGAAMRAMCIGLRYPKDTNISDLIAVSIESGRMTHHNPTGYLGAFAAALFTSYAVQKKPIKKWGKDLVSELPKAKQYIIDQGRDVEENLQAWPYFEEKWKNYLKIRKIQNGKSEPDFPQNFDVEARDAFYKEMSFSGWGGASGHDAPMIAYDALLGSNGSWEELCLRGMLHGGDNDSTGVMAGAWFGALYGFKDVPKGHYEKLEKRDELESLAKEIYRLTVETPVE